jgi:hypothetical protein
VLEVSQSHTGWISIYIVPFETNFRDKPQNIFPVAREESAFYLRGATGRRPASAG